MKQSSGTELAALCGGPLPGAEAEALKRKYAKLTKYAKSLEKENEALRDKLRARGAPSHVTRMEWKEPGS